MDIRADFYISANGTIVKSKPIQKRSKHLLSLTVELLTAVSFRKANVRRMSCEGFEADHLRFPSLLGFWAVCFSSGFGVGVCGFFLVNFLVIRTTTSFPGGFVLALMKSTNILRAGWAAASPRSVPVLSSVIDKGSVCGPKMHWKRTNIWKSFPNGVDRECTGQTGSCNVSPVSLCCVRWPDNESTAVSESACVFMWPHVCAFLLPISCVLCRQQAGTSQVQGGDGAEWCDNCQLQGCDDLLLSAAVICCSNVFLLWLLLGKQLWPRECLQEEECQLISSSQVELSSKCFSFPITCRIRAASLEWTQCVDVALV